MPAFDAFAVTAKSGPHVTLQAGTNYMGRHWTTTTRRSAKVASIKRTERAAATSVEGSGWRVTGGTAAVLDVSAPASFVNSAFDTALAPGAMVRLGLDQLEQLVGYAEAGAGVPPDFLPAGRVMLVTHVEDEMVLDGYEVIESSGRWSSVGERIEPRPWAGESWDPERLLVDVPGPVRALAAEPTSCWLGVSSPSGAVALPGHWEPTTGTCVVSRHALDLVGAGSPDRLCVTFDDSVSRRPDEKLGLMFRGTGAVVDVASHVASLRVGVARVTHWSGFESTTVAVSVDDFAS